MADFVAPENTGFVAPENNASQPPKPSFLGDVAKQAGKAALFPLMAPAKIAEPLAEGFVAPENDPLIELNERAKREGYISLEQSPYYPSQAYTSLAPTLDAFSAPFIAKDIATLGFKGVKAIIGKSAKTKGLENFVAKMPEINSARTKPELPLGPIDDVRSPVPSAMNAPKMEEDIAGATLRDTTATAEPLRSPLVDAPKIEVYSKGTMGGGVSPNTGKPLPKTTIWGVKGDPKAIEELGFGPNPASVPETVLRQKGIPLPGDVAPKPPPVFGKDLAAPLPEEIETNARMIAFEPSDIRELNKKGNLNLPVPPEQLPLSGIEANKGLPTKPFTAPTLEAPLPAGAKERIAKLSTVPEGKDLSARHPFSTTADQATQAGKLEPVLQEQLQTGLKMEAEAERKANTVLQTFKKMIGYEPESLESKALSMYARSPNKALAKQELIQQIGEKETAKMIAAEVEMRQTYDDLIQRLNIERSKQGEPLIPYREDYLPQLHESNLLNDLGMPKLIGTPEGEAIVKQLYTDQETLKASKWYHSSEIAFKHLKQQGLPDVEDAVTGYQRYVREAERKMALQPHVNELLQTAEAIKGKYPNLATEMINRADHIAGKVNSLDASLAETFGSKAMNTFYEATSRMKGNLIQGNPSVPVSQTFILPSLIADLPVRDAMASAVKSMASTQFRQFLIKNSPTLQLRLAAREATGINQGKIAQALSAPSDFVDTNTLMFSMGGKFMQLIREGKSVEEAVKGAEQFASLTQATLSKLSTAPALRSKTSQAVVPFMNQMLSQAKFVTTQLFKNKTTAEKAGAAIKMAATGGAIAMATQLLMGDNAKSPLSPTQYVPMGPVMEQGIGGPLLGSAGRILKAKSTEERLLQVFRSAMLLQNKIPAGLQVSKAVEGLFKRPTNED